MKKELSQNVKVLRQLFYPGQGRHTSNVWKTFGFFEILGITNQALLKKQCANNKYSACARLRDPNFRKMSF